MKIQLKLITVILVGVTGQVLGTTGSYSYTLYNRIPVKIIDALFKLQHSGADFGEVRQGIVPIEQAERKGWSWYIEDWWCEHPQGATQKGYHSSSGCVKPEWERSGSWPYISAITVYWRNTDGVPCPKDDANQPDLCSKTTTGQWKANWDFDIAEGGVVTGRRNYDWGDYTGLQCQDKGITPALPAQWPDGDLTTYNIPECP